MTLLCFARGSIRSLLTIATLYAVVGCGGGGGGSTPPPSSDGILVHTDWSSETALSERISILNSSGVVTAQSIVGKTSGTTSTSFVAPSGGYTVRIEQNAGANFSGATTGVMSVTTLTGSTAFTVVPGATPTTLRVTPDSADVAFGQKLRLGVAGATADGSYTFLPTSGLTFTATGGTATVDTNGVVTAGASAGTSTVQVTSGALSAKANINVAQATVVRSKWTVMVFLNASNDLYPYAVPNVTQMSQVAYNADVRFVIQWKESAKLFGSSVDFDGTRRYLVTPPGVTSGSIPAKLVQDMGAGVDMGSAQTLKDFVTWTKANYPADRYVCVVWNHGNGFARSAAQLPSTRAVSYDEEAGTYIDTWDLKKAFETQPVDVLSFDACLMQMMEVADDLKTSCAYIAASEENTPGPGYPYQRVFKAFADSPSSDTVSLLQSFVTGHVGNPSYADEPVTQSVVDVTKLPGVETALDGLAGALIDNAASLKTEIPLIRSAMQKYAYQGDGRFYYDLVDLCQHLNADANVPAAVKTAASGVVTAVASAVIWEGHSTLDANSHGIAIDFSPANDPALGVYPALNLSKTTRWLNWLKMSP